MNRAIYDLAVLFDPAGTGATGLAAWNRKLLWSFGGGSGTPYIQFPPNTAWQQADYALARGYLVAQSAHTDQQLNSNHVVAAETVMMGKEHVIERYGAKPPKLRVVKDARQPTKGGTAAGPLDDPGRRLINRALVVAIPPALRVLWRVALGAQDGLLSQRDRLLALGARRAQPLGVGDGGTK